MLQQNLFEISSFTFLHIHLTNIPETIHVSLFQNFFCNFSTLATANSKLISILLCQAWKQQFKVGLDIINVHVLHLHFVGRSWTKAVDINWCILVKLRIQCISCSHLPSPSLILIFVRYCFLSICNECFLMPLNSL